MDMQHCIGRSSSRFSEILCRYLLSTGENGDAVAEDSASYEFEPSESGAQFDGSSEKRLESPLLEIGRFEPCLKAICARTFVQNQKGFVFGDRNPIVHIGMFWIFVNQNIF